MKQLSTKQNSKVGMGREKLFSAPGSVPIKTTLEKSCTGKGIVVHPDSPKFLYLHTSRESTFILASLPGHSQILSHSCVLKCDLIWMEWVH